MRYLIVGLMVVSLKSFAADNTIPRNYGEEDRDARNSAFVQEKNNICKASKCGVCGQFFYYPNGNVGYESTSCEDLYVLTQMDQDRVNQDAEIRRKYAGEVKK